MKKSVGALALLLLAACQTTVGQGPIHLSGVAKAGFDHYMNNRDRVGYFAVAVDGRSSFNYIYCPDQGCIGMDKSRTIQACEKYSNGVPCKIYAFRKEIVWQFDKASEGATVAQAEPPRNVVRQARIDWASLDQASVGELQMERLGENLFDYDFVSEKQGLRCSGTRTDWKSEEVKWALDCNDGTKMSGMLRANASGTYFGTGFDQNENHLFLSLDPPRRK